MAIIQQVVNSPLDLQKVEVLERLLAMQERVQAQTRKQLFVEAMGRLQAKLPQIVKARPQLNKDGSLRNKYVPIEDIDVVLRPLCDEEGFSISCDTQNGNANQIILTCSVAHAAGHIESRSLPLPIDNSQFRTGGQNVASTITTGRRLLLKLHFNLIERDEDKDFADIVFINDGQAKDIGTLIQDTKSDFARFLKHFQISKLEELRALQYPEAMQMLRKKQGV